MWVPIGAMKEEAMVWSHEVALRADAARSALAAGAKAVAGSTMAAAEGAPVFIADAAKQAPELAKQVPGFAKEVPGRFMHAAKHVPEVVSDAWESLVAALERSSQLAGVPIWTASMITTP
jgi:hypothetical protein